MVKVLFSCLLALFFCLQYKLWISPQGYLQVAELKQQIANQQHHNDKLILENEHVRHKVMQLKNQSSSAIEDYARREFGMVKPDEVFFQFS